MRSGLLAVVLALAGFFAKPAFAYPFMIGHGYTACAQCHTDPSGGSALTDYGRGQAEIFMRTTYGAPVEEPGPIKNFAFGVTLPKELQLQADARGMFIPQPGNFRFLLMQADMRAHLNLSGFRAYGSLGYVTEGADLAWVTSNATGGNVVSREHWLGYDVAKGTLVRAGRLSLPYGIRTEEHILFARTATRTTSNDDQQLGLDATYTRGKIRAELMGIAGNYQIAPDDYRERGYSLLAAYAFANTMEVGVSSLVTSSALDIDYVEPRLRQAHGVFARYAPLEAVRLLAEANTTVSQLGSADAQVGTVGYLQVDTEPTRGLHLRGTGEWCDDDHADADASALRGSFTALWFFAPHADIRLDAMYGTLYCTPGEESRPMALAQLHTYL